MSLRIGLLGASRIAPRAVIEPARASGGEVEVAVAASTLARAQAYAAEHAIPAAVEGYAALAERADVDVVYCALPPAAHRDACVQALQAGKALLVEKPFALNAEDAAAIAAAAEAAGRPALEAFHYRFHPLFARALQLLREGAIGRPVRAEGWFQAEIARRPGELRWDPALGGGGTMDLGCYVLHALRTVFGAEPEVISAVAEVEDGVDATMTAQLRFPDGAIARSVSAMRGPRRDGLRLEGEAGALAFEGFVAPHRGGRLTLTRGADVQVFDAEGPSTYQAQLRHLLDVWTGRAAPLTGGADAVANMQLVDEVLAQSRRP